MNNPAGEDHKRLHAIVTGRVQGVGFRYYVVEQAESLGVTGWVRNRGDDTVEVTAEGTKQALDRLVAQLQRGPASAYVSRVQVQWEQPGGTFREFRMRSTV